MQMCFVLLTNIIWERNIFGRKFILHKIEDIRSNTNAKIERMTQSPRLTVKS